MKEPSQADLVRRKIMAVKMCLYATPAYVEEHGMPDSLEDMKTHRLISQSVNSAQVGAASQLVAMLLTHEIPLLLTVNNYFGVLQAVLADLGVGVLPDYVTQDFPNLIRILPDVESNDVPVFLAYPEELRQSRRIAAFRDFVTEEIIAYRKNRKKVGQTA